MAAPVVALAHEDLFWSGGYGELDVGKTRAQIERLYPPSIREAVAGGRRAWFVLQDDGDPADCAEYELYAGSELFLMLEKGVLTRVSTYHERYPTARGVRVGDSESKVLAAYRGVRRTPAVYADAPAHDLVWWERPGRGLRFEITAEGNVASIHAGTESIRYIEGCL